MRLKSALLFILFTVSFTSCEKEKNLTFKEGSFNIENNDIIEINIIKATDKNSVSDSINNTLNKVITSSLHIGDPDNVPRRTIEESISLFNEEFRTFKNVFPDSALQWEAQIDGEVQYQSPEIICIALTTYINTGGAHGNLNISFLNFNRKNGILLTNNKLFNNINSVKEKAGNHFKLDGNDLEDFTFNNGFELPINIGYNEDGVILLYNTYEIAPYSKGITEINIPYNEISEYLNFK
jgi:hypothetical protein